MQAFFALPFFLASMIADMIARKRNDDKLVSLFQPLTTFFVVLIALLGLFSPGARPGFTVGIVVGLVVSFAADMILIHRKDPASFMKGMLLFFIALLVYSGTLSFSAGFHVQDLYCVPALLAYYAFFIKLLWMKLGKMRIPVLAYGLVFCLCVSRAFSCFFSPDFSLVQSILLVCGTSLFLLGDTQLAYYHFVDDKFPMFWAPAFYFVGQCLIGLSTGFF